MMSAQRVLALHRGCGSSKEVAEGPAAENLDECTAKECQQLRILMKTLRKCQQKIVDLSKV